MPINYNNPTSQQVLQAVQAGQSETVEFFEGVPSVGRLAMSLSGLANRNGGAILIGVRDEPRALVPYDLGHLNATYDRAAASLKPGVNSMMHPLDNAQGRVGVITVQQSAQVVVSPLGPYLREGATTRIMTADEVRQRLPQVHGQPDLSVLLVAM